MEMTITISTAMIGALITCVVVMIIAIWLIIVGYELWSCSKRKGALLFTTGIIVLFLFGELFHRFRLL